MLIHKTPSEYLGEGTREMQREKRVQATERPCHFKKLVTSTLCKSYQEYFIKSVFAKSQWIELIGIGNQIDHFSSFKLKRNDIILTTSLPHVLLS